MSLVNFKARNHPQQAVRDQVDDRRTPLNVWNPLNDAHRFTVDVAASEKNHLCEKYYTRHTDGLLKSWAGERVWCNPPFSRLEPWVAKAWHEMREGCESVVMILPANRCEQKFWQEFVEPFRDAPPRRRYTPHLTLPAWPRTLRRTRRHRAPQRRQTALRLRDPHLGACRMNFGYRPLEKGGT